MKKIVLNILLLFTCLPGAQAQTGSLDPDFADQGISVTAGYARTSVQQADGKIVTVNAQPGVLHILRFMPDGSLDSAFGVNGTAYFQEPTGTPSTNNVIVQPDGKIVIAGDQGGSYFRLFVCRLNPDGSTDSSFANNGSLVHAFQAIDHMSIRVNNLGGNKLLVSGIVGFSSRTPFYLKLNEDGSFDTTYGTNGVVFLSGLGFAASLPDTEVQPDGKIVTICTSLETGTANGTKIMRLNTDGSLDNTMGINGVASHSLPYSINAGQLFLQSDGKIVIASSALVSMAPEAYGAYIARYLPNGSPDLAFGANGITVHGAANWQYMRHVEVQPSDGKIVIFGEKRALNGQKIKAYVARFSAAGTLDTEFGEPQTTFFPNQDEYYVSGHIAADGGIIAVGYSGSNSRVLAKYISCANSITTQPQPVSSAAGTTATFTATSSSSAAIYQWQIMDAGNWENISNGGQYSGAQSASLSINNLTAANDGQQYRTISSSGVCVDTSSAAVLTVTSPSSINELSTTQAFSIYPNPVADVITIEGELKVNRVQITDLLGRSIAVFEGNNRTKLQINLPPMSAGIYGLRIATQDGISNYKIIKK